MVLCLLRLPWVYKPVSKLVPEVDGFLCVVILPSIVDKPVEGLELLPLCSGEIRNSDTRCAKGSLTLAIPSSEI